MKPEELRYFIPHTGDGDGNDSSKTSLLPQGWKERFLVPGFLDNEIFRKFARSLPPDAQRELVDKITDRLFQDFKNNQAERLTAVNEQIAKEHINGPEEESKDLDINSIAIFSMWSLGFHLTERGAKGKKTIVPEPDELTSLDTDRFAYFWKQKGITKKVSISLITEEETGQQHIRIVGSAQKEQKLNNGDLRRFSREQQFGLIDRADFTARTLQETLGAAYDTVFDWKKRDLQEKRIPAQATDPRERMTVIFDPHK